MRNKPVEEWSLADYSIADRNEKWIIAYIAVLAMIVFLVIAMIVDPSRSEGETWQQDKSQSQSAANRR